MIQARSILGLVANTMTTKFDYQLFAAGKLLLRSDDADAFNGKLVTLIHEGQRSLGYSPGLMSALVRNACEEALGGVSDDSETLRDKLPSRVGAHKAIGWAVRANEGESYEEISSNTHSTDAETVAKAVDEAATYIDIDESEGTATE